MTVITIEKTDPGLPTRRWNVPNEPVLMTTPIPRGLRTYGNQKAVAALGANDETSVVITLEFPIAFAYVAKSLSIEFLSDDITTEFNNIGSMDYVVPVNVINQGKRSYELLCDGPSIQLAVRSQQIYRPMGSWKHWIQPSETITLMIQDMSGDTSTAGDVKWTAEFWEYDIEQFSRWPINSPMPTIAY